eukprot:Skav206808  [mRNA]  locus=scaffold1990:310438:313959:- [translate_table: standard]
MRLAQLPVEMWFGRLRGRSATAQLNARDYYRASAKEMVRAQRCAEKDPTRLQSDHSNLEPVSAEEFADISKRALLAATRLAAWASGLTEESLRAKYKQLAGNLISPSEEDPDNLHEWEKDEQEAWEDDVKDSGAAAKCKDLLDDVKRNAEAGMEEANAEHVRPEAEMEEADQDNGIVVDNISHVPDAAALEEVLKATDQNESNEEGHEANEFGDDRGVTLSDTLRICSHHFVEDVSDPERVASIFDSLWRFLMYLRHWRGGCDRSGNVVIMVVPRKGSNTRLATVGLVISVWRGQKKPQLATAVCSLGHVIALRCIVLQPAMANPKKWIGDDHSVPWVLRPEALVAVLDVESSHQTMEGIEISVTQESQDLVSESLLLGEWWPCAEKEGDQQSAQRGVYAGRRRKRGQAKPAKPADTKDKPADVAGDDAAPAVPVPTSSKNGKKKHKTPKKINKEAKLQKAAASKQIPFQPEYFKRNGSGPIVVRQTMEKLKALDEQFFSEKPSFDDDGKCLIPIPKCKGVLWIDILTTAHTFFCKRCRV